MSYRTISADCHIDMTWMPGDLWVKNAPARFRDLVPQVTPDAGWSALVRRRKGARSCTGCCNGARRSRGHTVATPSTSIKKSGWNRLRTTIKVLAGSSPGNTSRRASATAGKSSIFVM